MKPGVSNAKKKAVLLDQKIQISSIVVRSSNINDLWDWMSEANKVLRKNRGSMGFFGKKKIFDAERGTEF